MKDASNPPKSSADRQREWKARMREKGYQLKAIWVHSESEAEGREAAKQNLPCSPIGSKDPMSWATGWVAEKTKQAD